MDEKANEDIDMVIANDFYPKRNMVSDDGINSVPFNLLAGESGCFRGRTSEGIIIVTNYRLFHTEGIFFNIPLGVIDYIECRDIFYLYIYCKDGRTFRCIFDNNDDAQNWFKRMQSVIQPPEKTECHFGFGSFLWTVDLQKGGIGGIAPHSLYDLKHSSAFNTNAEAQRMGFDLVNVWKITNVNAEYELCPSYPKDLIVPISVNDQELKSSAYFRYSKRIPAVVWRNRRNGCVIARSSQPRMGIFGWREVLDEKLIQSISDACRSDRGEETKNNGREDELYSLKNDIENDLTIFCDQTQNSQNDKNKLLIIDARSYAAAMTNRAKGGGYECYGYYPNCEVQFMGLANIHTIRNSFASLRTLCTTPENPNWLSLLENTRWLHHISGLLKAALVVVNAVDVEMRPVLVHCSDGWDRTPQIVALAEIMLDPYYRTKKGFQVLVEKEWLEFGHKFADRCGHSDGTDDRNERSPVFLQWLDCVYQLLMQFECDFEFNQQYLVRLAVHTYSNLFGDFFFNTDQNRKNYRVSKRTFSIWPLLNERNQFHNYLYNHSNKVLHPSYQIRKLHVWMDVYLPDDCISLEKSTVSSDENVEKSNLVKTKSCDNIPFADHSQSLQRHSSDPNLVDNSFDDHVSYPKIPDFLDRDSYPLSNSDIPLNKIIPEGNSILPSYNKSVSSQRTGNICNGGPNSNLCPVSDKCPDIDGSTDTLVSENETVVKEQPHSIIDEICDAMSNLKPACSVSTSTRDLPVSVEDILQTLMQNVASADSKLPNWSQNILHAYITNKRNSNASNSCSCSYTTPNHSRTPSSGFPATPCDDSNEMPSLKNACVQTLDVDGLNVIPMPVQERVKKIILHYKNKVSNIQNELSTARYEFLYHFMRYYNDQDCHNNDTDDAPSLAGSACSGEQHADSRGSESSWDMCAAEHGAVNYVV